MNSKDPSKPYAYNRFFNYLQDLWIILGIKKMQDLEIFEEELTEDRIIWTELVSKLK